MHLNFKKFFYSKYLTELEWDKDCTDHTFEIILKEENIDKKE